MIDDVFAVIADSTRRQILQALAGGRRPVGELVEELGISQPTVSKHLRVLRNVGLVKSEAAGQKRFYSLTPEPLSVVTQWIENLQTQAPEAAAPSEENTIHAVTAPEPAEKETAQATTAATPFVSTETRGIPVVSTQQVDPVVPEPETASLPPAPATPEAPAMPPAPPAPVEVSADTPIEPAEPIAEASEESVADTTAEVELVEADTAVEMKHAIPMAEDEPASSEEASEEVSKTDKPARDDEGFFTLGDEGEIHQHTQSRRSHHALNFTPLEPFTPESSANDADDDPTTSIDLASIPLLPADSADTNLDVVVVEEDYDFDEAEATDIVAENEVAKETDQVADDGLPSGYVAYTGESVTTEFVDDVPSTDSTEELEASAPQQEVEPEAVEETVDDTDAVIEEKTETQVVLENADAAHPSETDHDAENHEARGFLASLTRWGRRRSR